MRAFRGSLWAVTTRIVNGLAVGVFGLDDLLVGVFNLDFLAVFVLHDFEVAGLVFADGAGFLEDFDLGLAFGHVLLDGGGVVSGGKGKKTKMKIAKLIQIISQMNLLHLVNLKFSLEIV